MRRFQCVLLATVAIIGFASIASAADMPVKAHVAPPVAYNWTGFYVGINGGYGWGRDQRTDTMPAAGSGFWTRPAGSGTDTLNPTGGLFGGQIGYNFQSGVWVLGIEATGDWASLTQTKASIFAPTTDTWSSKVSAIYTATGRVGYAMGAWLPYAKGGYAGAQMKAHMDSTLGGGTSLDSGNLWVNGWTLGAGLEYMIASNWIVGIEYDYMSFASKSWISTDVIAGGGAGNIQGFRDKLSVSEILARVSYKFN